MKQQADLFSSPESSDLVAKTAAARAANGSQALQIDRSRKDQALTPTQRRFNKLLGQIQSTTERIAKVRELTDRHRPRHHAILDEIAKRHQAQLRAMVLGLEAHVQVPLRGQARGKGLTPLQKVTAIQILVQLAQVLVRTGHADMVALHDRYSEQSMADKEREALNDLKSMMDDVVGGPFNGPFNGPFGDDDDDEVWNPADPITREEAAQGSSAFGDFEALMQSVRQRLQERAEALQREADAKQAAKKSKKSKPSKAEEAQADAQSTLRALFRQLASALHPDRETDPQERERKTALMSEVNAAYQKRDLMALMQLQLRVQLVNPQDIAKMADKKVAAFNLLLKEQLATLEDDWYELNNRVRDEFQIPIYVFDITAIILDSLLVRQQNEKEAFVQHVASEIEIIQSADIALFKRWLADQRRLERQRLRDIERDVDFVDGYGEF